MGQIFSHFDYICDCRLDQLVVAVPLACPRVPVLLLAFRGFLNPPAVMSSSESYLLVTFVGFLTHPHLVTSFADFAGGC